MHTIDDVQEAIKPMQAISNHPLSRTELDPVVFTSEEGDVWTLGMVIPMREWVFKQTTALIFVTEILPHYYDACAIG
jgi:hypothetical protein